MVGFGECVKCKDTCVITNEITNNGEKKHITTCVKPCAVDSLDVICETCLETFNKGKRNKIGQVLK